ncbi:MAG: S8 family serine peptidase, partial [Bacteroidota bacterium]
MIASAGNRANNNNVVRHYPSGYNNPYLIAIGAHNEMIDAMAPYSNYGSQTVAFAAPGAYFVGQQPTDPVEGTSYSAAFVSARALELLATSGSSNENILELLLQNSTYNQKLDIQHVLKYPRTINP